MESPKSVASAGDADPGRDRRDGGARWIWPRRFRLLGGAAGVIVAVSGAADGDPGRCCQIAGTG